MSTKTQGGLIGAWDGKCQDQVGVQCIQFQFYPSCKLFFDSVKLGEGLTNASTCNGTFVLEFAHFLKTGGRVGGQQKSTTTFGRFVYSLSMIEVGHIL